MSVLCFQVCSFVKILSRTSFYFQISHYHIASVVAQLKIVLEAREDKSGRGVPLQENNNSKVEQTFLPDTVLPYKAKHRHISKVTN